MRQRICRPFTFTHCSRDGSDDQLHGAARDAFKLATWDDYLEKIDLDLTPALPHETVENSLGSPSLEQQARSILERWHVPLRA